MLPIILRIEKWNNIWCVSFLEHLVQHSMLHRFGQHQVLAKLSQNKNHPSTYAKGGWFLFWHYARATFTAAGPFWPSATSKVTSSPTFSSSNATPTSDVEWKKRSFSSPSREMNPNPESLRVFIVPFMWFFNLLFESPTVSCILYTVEIYHINSFLSSNVKLRCGKLYL